MKPLIVIFPKRGKPPVAPEGYTQEPGDPYVFHLKWKSCIYHGLDNSNHICGLYLKLINQNDCNRCNSCIEGVYD